MLCERVHTFGVDWSSVLLGVDLVELRVRLQSVSLCEDLPDLSQQPGTFTFHSAQGCFSTSSPVLVTVCLFFFF